MAEIVDLDELVPADIVFKYRGKEYTMSGDIDTESVFKLFRMYAEIDTTDAEGSEKTTRDLKQFLFELFSVNDATLKPEDMNQFGIKSLPIVTRKILSQLGIDVAQDPPSPTPRAGRGRTQTGRTRAQARRKSAPSPG